MRIIAQRELPEGIVSRAEKVLTKPREGVTLSPYLQPHRSEKKGGHPVVIRITANKQHVYLPTGLFSEKKEFNEVKKVLTNPSKQEMLDDFIAAAVALAAEHGADLELIKTSWNKVKIGVKTEKVIMDFFTRHQHYTLDMMLAEREQLEAQLFRLNTEIESASKSLKRVVTKRAATEREKQTFKQAMNEFQATWMVLQKRDQQAWSSWFRTLEECCKFNKLVPTLELFNLDFYAKYAHYILHEKDNYDNTFGAHVKRLKSFLKFSEAQGHPVNPGCKDKRFKILEEEKEVIYLDETEMNDLWAFKQLMPSYSKVIDLATFQNLTGLRVSDLMKQHLVSQDKGHPFLKGICKKNEGEYNIPLELDGRIKEILEFYNYNLAILSEAQYNKQLKVVLGKMYEHQGISIKVEIRPTKLGVAYPYYSPKQEEISSHSLRRSFCTRHINGSHFNQNDILKMLGSSDLSELQKYMRTETSSLVTKAQAAAASSL